MADLQRELGILLDQQQRDALGCDLADDLEDFLHQHRRQSHARFVQQQQSRTAQQRAADSEHLLLAAGKRAGKLAAAFGETREQAVGARHVPANPGAIAARIGAEA